MRIFIGNSHLDQFILNHSHGVLVLHPGASIKGLLNPCSITGLNKRIGDFTNSKNTFIFHLGQVDFEFGYYYKSVLTGYKLDKAQFISGILSVYETYLQSLPNKKVIIGLNPTAIDDMFHTFNINFNDLECGPNNSIQETGEVNDSFNYSSLGHIYNDSIEERNTFLEMANQEMKRMCMKNGIEFIDLWPLLFDCETHTLGKEFHPGCLDHHIKPSETLREYLLRFV